MDRICGTLLISKENCFDMFLSVPKRMEGFTEALPTYLLI